MKCYQFVIDVSCSIMLTLKRICDEAQTFYTENITGSKFQVEVVELPQ